MARKTTTTHTYQMQVEVYDWRKDTYSKGPWSAPTAYDSDRKAEEGGSAFAKGTPNATRVYIRRDDGNTWYIG